MLGIAINTIEIFVILSLIGIGPALVIFKNPLEFCFSIAPAIGLALSTLAGTYLIHLDYPISDWAIVWPAIAITISILLCIYSSYQKPPVNNYSNIKALSFGLIVTSLLVFIPIIIGGLTFTVLRGNGSDTFNYITMAGYLQHEPFSWIHTATDKALIDKHPTYLSAKVLLKTRWSTSVILGWCSTLMRSPLERFEYGFTTLFFLITYCCTFSIALRLSLKKNYAALLAIAICVGFWAQFILDVRAMSQISALPLFVLFVLLLLHAEENNTNHIQQAAMAATIAAIAFLYIELLPLITLGLLLFFLNQLIRKQDTLINLIKKYWLVFTLSFLLLIPIAHTYLLHFFKSQITTAIHHKNNWDIVYFQWLYKQPLIGFWGLSSLEAATSLITGKVLFNTISIILTIILLYGTIHSCVKWNKNKVGTNICIAFLLATGIEFSYLFFNGQFWAAGKALSFGYIFPSLLIAIFSLTNLFNSSKNKYFFRISQYTVLLWLIIQCGLSFYRIETARTQTDYYNYIGYHGLYRKHDWDISALTNIIKQKKPLSVGLSLPNIWTLEYFSFAWGWDTSIIDINGIGNESGKLITKKILTSIPDYFVIPSDHYYFKQSKILAHNKEFLLIEKPKDFFKVTAHPSADKFS